MPIDEADATKVAAAFAGECMIPGGSQLMKGELVQGGVHLLAGIAARMAFGVPGVVLVSANSLSRTLTGKSLLEAVGLWKPSETRPSQPTSYDPSAHPS